MLANSNCLHAACSQCLGIRSCSTGSVMVCTDPCGPCDAGAQETSTLGQLFPGAFHAVTDGSGFLVLWPCRRHPGITLCVLHQTAIPNATMIAQGSLYCCFTVYAVTSCLFHAESCTGQPFCMARVPFLLRIPKGFAGKISSSHSV